METKDVKLLLASCLASKRDLSITLGLGFYSLFFSSEIMLAISILLIYKLLESVPHNYISSCT